MGSTCIYFGGQGNEAQAPKYKLCCIIIMMRPRARNQISHHKFLINLLSSPKKQNYLSKLNRYSFIYFLWTKIKSCFYSTTYHVVWTGVWNLGLALKAVDSILKHEYQQSTQAFTTYSQRSLEFDCRRQQLEKKRCSKVYISQESRCGNHWEKTSTFRYSFYLCILF